MITPRPKPPASASEPPAAVLTDDQRKAAAALGRNVLVSAGAGSGKTRVLVERFLALVLSGQASLSEILVLTFTDKAANEMKSRILSGLQRLNLHHVRREMETAYISTFHAFAARILREHPLEAGLDPEFRVLEEEEAAFLREEAMEEAVDLLGQKGSETYELLRVYGEEKIREGLLKILNAARHEGRMLEHYLKACQPPVCPATPSGLFDRLGETGLAADWQKFETADWDWDTFDRFHEWRKTWSRKRDKKDGTEWKEARARVMAWASWKLEPLAAPWRQRFETLALAFEAGYEARKKEKALLDFDDLGMRALRLFQSPSRAHQKLLETYRRKFRFIFVDEFQDTNTLQLSLVEHLSSGDNLFLVGDFKQSIYGFRGAEPGVFLEKEAAYRNNQGGSCLSLAENFRTAPGVLEVINGFFENLWEEDGLGFEPLKPMKDALPGAGTELMILRPEEDEPADMVRMREAEALAARILELRKQGTAFGEIALLFQAMTKSGIYEQALKRSGIPYVIYSGGGFYHQPEIRDMISVLAHLENPLSPIPLAAALRSPLFQVRDATLFWLTRDAAGAAAPLYQGLKRFREIPEISEAEKEKLSRFAALTGQWLAMKDRLRITELLDQILAGTSYDLTVLADPQGARRYANLKKMIAVAREFEALEPIGVGHFLSILKRLETRDVRESEAQIEAEGAGDAVRLMTIHKAKGLEFPVVIIPDLGRSGRAQAGKTVLADSRFGYGLTVRHEKTQEFEAPLSWEIVNERLNRRESGEWKRLLYVAMTRAQRRLILCGAWNAEKEPGEKESYHEMSSWMEWLLASPPEGIEVREIKSERRTGKAEPLAETRQLVSVFPQFQPRDPSEFLPEPEREGLVEEASRLREAVEGLVRVPSRAIHLPVSAYAAFSKDPEEYRRVYETGWRGPDEDYEGLVLQDSDEVSAADFGTAMHHVLEKADFRDPKPDRMKEMLDHAFGSMGPAYREEAGEILERFWQSPLLQRLRQARRLCRELPFILGERHGMIHGVIDLLYQDAAGDWHVVDYKTAVGDAAKVAASGYETQIELYAHAVRVLSGVAPRSGSLFFLKNGWEHRLEWKAADWDAAGQRIQAAQQRILESACRET